MDNRPIGVFDSGVGGLTVVKQIIKTMPYEHTIYFGDTARVPYGSKSKETVTKFSSQIIRFLKTMDVKAVVIACNTVSSNCYEALTSEFPDLPIIEVVTPGVESCLAATKNNKVGLIGTEGTVSSGAYEKRLKAANNQIEVYMLRQFNQAVSVPENVYAFLEKYDVKTTAVNLMAASRLMKKSVRGSKKSLGAWRQCYGKGSFG